MRISWKPPVQQSGAGEQDLKAPSQGTSGSTASPGGKLSLRASAASIGSMRLKSSEIAERMKASTRPGRAASRVGAKFMKVAHGAAKGLDELADDELRPDSTAPGWALGKAARLAAKTLRKAGTSVGARSENMKNVPVRSLFGRTKTASAGATDEVDAPQHTDDVDAIVPVRK